MVTGGPTIVEFEHKGSKIETLTANCVALTAGDALVSKPFFKRVRAKVESQEQTEGRQVAIEDVVGTVRDLFIEERLKRAELVHLIDSCISNGTWHP
jgi:hypothetical protein